MSIGTQATNRSSVTRLLVAAIAAMAPPAMRQMAMPAIHAPAFTRLTGRIAPPP
jgi:hypothetical protein